MFSNDRGRELLLAQIGRSIYSEPEKKAAYQLTERLGGLALALVVMASQIRLRKLSIASFLRLYEKHGPKLHKETLGVKSFYKFSLATCWKDDIGYLGANASRLLGVIAHLGPDSLPEDLFHPADDSTLPEGMEFCADHWE